MSTLSFRQRLPLQLALQLLQHQRLEVGRAQHGQLDAGGSTCAGQVRDATLAQQPRQLTQQILHRHAKLASVLCMFLCESPPGRLGQIGGNHFDDCNAGDMQVVRHGALVCIPKDFAASWQVAW